MHARVSNPHRHSKSFLLRKNFSSDKNKGLFPNVLPGLIDFVYEAGPELWKHRPPNQH